MAKKKAVKKRIPALVETVFVEQVVVKTKRKLLRMD